MVSEFCHINIRFIREKSEMILYIHTDFLYVYMGILGREVCDMEINFGFLLLYDAFGDCSRI